MTAMARMSKARNQSINNNYILLASYIPSSRDFSLYTNNNNSSSKMTVKRVKNASNIYVVI